MLRVVLFPPFLARHFSASSRLNHWQKHGRQKDQLAVAGWGATYCSFVRGMVGWPVGQEPKGFQAARSRAISRACFHLSGVS
jgi:hypothetical protein